MIYKLLFILNNEYNLMNTSLRPPNTASHLFCLSLSPSVLESTFLTPVRPALCDRSMLPALPDFETGSH